ncbi:MAG: hypothetical protein WDZ37_05330 [Solirubrobacterales bacterium]
MDDQPSQPHSRRPESESAAGDIEHECVELCPICRGADVLRATLPPEFHEQWHAVQREAMLALRAALDHYIAHLDSEPDDEPRVEDIPIG